jgi:hypothetical protein
MSNTNEPHCNLSDLPVSMCAHCKPGTESRPMQSESDDSSIRISRSFYAMFDNPDGCSCGEDIEEGDYVAFVNDELSCEKCVSAAREIKKKEVSKFTRKWRVVE